jgi:predicted XRE-type DNA-binding protein
MSKSKAPSSKTEEHLGEIAETLMQIRRLMIFSLIRNGASQDQVAVALGVSQKTISRMMAKTT